MAHHPTARDHAVHRRGYAQGPAHGSFRGHPHSKIRHIKPTVILRGPYVGTRLCGLVCLKGSRALLEPQDCTCPLPHVSQDNKMKIFKLCKNCVRSKSGGRACATQSKKCEDYSISAPGPPPDKIVRDFTSVYSSHCTWGGTTAGRFLSTETQPQKDRL